MLPVSLNNRTCICGRRKISGIHCSHGIRAIFYVVKDPLDYVSDWYFDARYREAYKGNILSIPYSDQWPNLGLPDLLPPTMKRGIGRPSRNRRREEGEKGREREALQFNARNASHLGTPLRHMQRRANI